MTAKKILTAETVPDLFAAVDSGDADQVPAYFHDDVELVFGNNEPSHGVAGYAATNTAFMATLHSIRHEIHDVWAVENDTVVIAVMTVHYTKKDGTQISLPCTNLLRLEDGLIRHYQIYMDVNPLFA
jgi:ketosteroid isomerase-like protein